MAARIPKLLSLDKEGQGWRRLAGVVGTRMGRTTPATACGHRIPSRLSLRGGGELPGGITSVARLSCFKLGFFSFSGQRQKPPSLNLPKGESSWSASTSCSPAFFQRQIIEVYRIPYRKTFRAHLLGLAAGFILVLTVMFFGLPQLLTSVGIPGLLVLFFLFVLGTWIGGLFVLFTALVTILPDSPFSLSSGAFGFLAEWFFAGYLGGAICATLYNDFVFIAVFLLSPHRVRLAFAYDTGRNVNIIKSPNSVEQAAFQELLQTRPDLRDRKWYDYELTAAAPETPYTIVFAANPRIRRRNQAPADLFPTDPIIQDRNLFLQSVDWAMQSLERDEVVGRPEIWSRVRIITIFDTTLSVPLAQEYPHEISFGGNVAENLLDTVLGMPYTIAAILGNAQLPGLSKRLTGCHVDVIYVMSAWPTHDRSTARYSDFREASESTSCNQAGGRVYPLDPDPLLQKVDGLGISEINVTRCGDPGFFCEHDHFTSYPGRVALNVLGARSKTFIHEFGHAMSSVLRGAICDEYFDLSQVQTSGTTVSNLPQAPLYVNRIERVQKLTSQFVPVHKLFARYNGIDYYSDQVHPSAEESWLGYFPECHDRTACCTMDRTYGRYRFDRLISTFMYDRICCKLNRPGL